MNNDKLSWFPLYFERFILGTLDMNTEEVGAYFLMLCHQWDKGFVPNDLSSIRKITRMHPRKNLNRVLVKFRLDGDRLINHVLEEIRSEQEGKMAKRSESGKKAAKKRWEPNAFALQTQYEPNANREEKNRKEEKREITRTVGIELLKMAKTNSQIMESFRRQINSKFPGSVTDAHFENSLQGYVGWFDGKHPNGESLLKFSSWWSYYLESIKKLPELNHGNKQQSSRYKTPDQLGIE